MILNLGAGKKIRADSLNVDITDYMGVNEVVDLRKYPWPWKDGEVDGIHVSHLLEHFIDQGKFIMECHRILRPGGFLRIVGPHSSSVTSIGCLGHFRTYSYNTFHDYLAKPFYMFNEPMFKTMEQRLNWWYENPDAERNLPSWTIPWIKTIDVILSGFGGKFPRFTENVLCSFIQYREVVWWGNKL